MREIESIEEIHKILLSIANAFAEVCDKNNIPYCMIGGTMLGAIRHKGFIPWDDDMDFGVYSEHYCQLKKILEKELPSPYKCISFENCESVKYPFFKIEDDSTRVLDKTVNLPLEAMTGLNIDIFPLFPCNGNNWEVRRLNPLKKLTTLLYVESDKDCLYKKIIRWILRFTIRMDKKKWLQFLYRKADSLKGAYRGNLFGRWREREIFPEEVYQNLEEYNFETIKLKGIKQADRYLRQMYGDYMKLPTKDKQLTHISNVYWK